MCLYTHKVMRRMCYSACLTSQDSMLDCVPVKEYVLEDMRPRKREDDEWDFIARLCSQYFETRFFTETETFCVLDYSSQCLRAESDWRRVGV